MSYDQTEPNYLGKGEGMNGWKDRRTEGRNDEIKSEGSKIGYLYSRVSLRPDPGPLNSHFFCLSQEKECRECTSSVSGNICFIKIYNYS